MGKQIKIWYDKEGDYLEVLFFEQKKEYFKETENDAVMEKVDEEGNVIGFFYSESECFKKETPFNSS